ncbi:MAG: hypothetical protein ACXVGN_00055 [Mycobacteriaceae bacterium]
MSKDFGSGQGGIQSSPSTQFPQKESGAPKTGFTEAPMSSDECCNFGEGPGIGANTRKIH